MRIFLISLLLLLLGACSEEQQNKISRLGVSWLEGDYKVTFVEGTFHKEWIVKDSKVTTEPQKGYYYFWVVVNGEKKYVQTPISRTFVEQL